MFGSILLLIEGDHLASACNIASNEERCYFHEMVEYFSVCKHMLILKSHPVEKCRFCNASKYFAFFQNSI